MSAKNAKKRAPARIPTPDTLTPAQAKVLALLLRGLGTAEICERLDIAENTMRNHVRALLAGFGVPSRAQLIVAALKRKAK